MRNVTRRWMKSWQWAIGIFYSWDHLRLRDFFATPEVDNAPYHTRGERLCAL